MTDRAILHVDMDAFYASVEQRDRPELQGRPVIVGAPRDARGVVSAASYEARAYGVHSAMPSRTAAAKCPQAVFLPPRMAHYVQVSRHIREIFERFTPLVEPLSLDEAFLDVTAYQRPQGGPVAVGKKIQDAIQTELSLTASVGLAHNKFLAKLGSGLEKPRGFVHFTPEDAARRIAPLPVEQLWGVGKATAPRMHAAGYHTFGDLAAAPLEEVKRRFGNMGPHLQALARGLDDRPVVPEREAKSIGREITFGEDTADRDLLRATLYGLAEDVGRRLRRAGLQARRITLKLRFDTFETLTRDVTLPAATNLDEVIFSEAWRLAERVQWSRTHVRLIGVSASYFDSGAAQLLLFAPESTRRAEVTRAADAVRDQWGPDSLRHAAALHPRLIEDSHDG